jgi:hypothetical protein
MMIEVSRIARALGCTSWRLNVEPRNAAAIALYESFGFACAFESRSLTVAWSRIDEAPHVAGVSTMNVAREDDERFERAFEVARGQLAAERARGRIIVAIEARDALGGVAAFDPAFPGASPFRVARAELAVPLLQAIRPHAPNDEIVHVAIENHPAACDALLALGAEVRLEIVHMSGALERQ